MRSDCSLAFGLSGMFRLGQWNEENGSYVAARRDTLFDRFNCLRAPISADAVVAAGRLTKRRRLTPVAAGIAFKLLWKHTEQT